MDVIRVIYHHEPEGWWAESPDVPGWYAGGESYAEIRQLAIEGVEFALERSGLVVEHYLPESAVLVRS